MATVDHACSSAEIARRGEEIYDRDLKRKLEATCLGKIVAIDVETGDYAVADTIIGASREVRSRSPHAEIFLLQVGERYLRRFGLRTKSDPT